jgi:hypothetical protein
LTLLCKGTAVSFEMQEGGTVVAGRAKGMFHDPTGRDWAKCSLLIAPYRMEGYAEDDDVPGYARAYKGRNHRMRHVSLELPDKGLDGWSNEGQIKKLWYTRDGTKRPGRYYHPIGKKTVFSIFRGKDAATLYQKGVYYRVQLGRACLLDDRGIVYP